MGGIAAVIDWRLPIGVESLNTMMTVVPHRGTAGVQQLVSEHAHLAEARTNADPDWQMASEAGITICGDLRLWNKGPLRDMVGGNAASRDMDDRQLILAAYRRVGWRSTLEALDGDFAFIIWDSKRRSLIAARDRFGVIPLFYQRTPTGIRIATEPKQLLAISEQVRADGRAAAHYLSDRRTCERDTYFEGVHRVLPAEVLEVTEDAFAQSRYWNREPVAELGLARSDVPNVYREHLTDAVRRRLETSSMTISQLSGGLDSTSIAASAQILTDQGFDADRFATVSYIVPGSTVDESKWISEIVERQPFAHHEFIPRLAGIAAYREDMWRVDGPFVMPDRDFFLETADYGRHVGADLLLVGTAGDDLVDDYELIADMVRQGSLTRAWRTLRATATWSRHPTRDVAAATLRRLVPQATKVMIRGVIPSTADDRSWLLTDDLHALSQENPCHASDPPVGAPSETQAAVVIATRSKNLVQANEAMEANAARSGMGVSHPHLDRELVEFVASIPIQMRPADGRPKTIVRRAYRGFLPDSVLDRTTGTYADDYMVNLLLDLAPAFTERFPYVTERAEGFIDGNAYTRLLNGLSTHEPDIGTFRRLWPAWTLMMWLDSLDRYGS